MATQALSEQPNLINVFEGVIGSVRQLVVNARDLHSFLQVGKRFASWIQERIGKYEFIENEDFIAISQNREIGHGRGKVDYHLTLDMAKELSMVENNDKGREARRYFIAMEKKALAQEPVRAIEYITQQQYDELAKDVQQLSYCFTFKQRAIWWAWAELRTLSGGEPVKKMPAEFFDVAKQKLKDMYLKSTAFRDLMYKTETAFFKKNANLVPEEMQLMLDQLD